MALLSDVLRVAGTTHNAVNYWRNRGYLRTKLARTTAGVAREISRVNAVEIGFMSALTAGGMPPSDAAGVVASWMKAEREGTLSPHQVWRRGTTATVGFSTAHFRSLFPDILGSALVRAGNEQEKALADVVQTLINTAVIVERVDALFSHEGQDKA